MRRRTGPLLTIAMMVTLTGAVVSPSPRPFPEGRQTPSVLPRTSSVLPMAVWYGGGTARAPMLERDARAKKELWRKDVRQIKALGFNTVRAWIDWASGEPAEQAYHFET